MQGMLQHGQRLGPVPDRAQSSRRQAGTLDGNRFVRAGRRRICRSSRRRWCTTSTTASAPTRARREAQANQGKLPELDDARTPIRSADAAVLLGRRERSRADGFGRVGPRLAARLARHLPAHEKQRTVIASVIPRVGRRQHRFLLLRALIHRLALFLRLRSSFARLRGTAEGWRHAPTTTSSSSSPSSLPTYARHAWQRGMTLDGFLPRVLELTYTAWDLEPFARDVGYDGPPFRWDPTPRATALRARRRVLPPLRPLARRHRLRHGHLPDRPQERREGSRRVPHEARILEIYDAMAEAAHTGRAYQTTRSSACCARSTNRA